MILTVAMNELSSEMHEMVEFAAQSEDADLVQDLRVRGNNSNSTYLMLSLMPPSVIWCQKVLFANMTGGMMTSHILLLQLVGNKL